MQGQTIPADFTLGEATDKYGVGAKVQVEVKVAATGARVGFATFTWLKYVKGSSTLAVVKDACGVVISLNQPYTVSNYGSEIHLAGPIAYALGTLVDGYDYWFWTGGTCPDNIVTGLDGDYLTISSGVAAGLGISLAGTTAQPGLTVTTGHGVSQGFALAADT
jgi:hypothetical protein